MGNGVVIVGLAAVAVAGVVIWQSQKEATRVAELVARATQRSPGERIGGAVEVGVNYVRGIFS